MAAGQHSTSPPTPQSECHSGVYVIRCKPTGKVYVGSAIRIARRWNTHRLDLAKGKHHSVLLQRAWNKYGPDAFEFSVLEFCSDEQLLGREQYHMDSLRAHDREYGFNVNPTAGSALGHKCSEETKAKLSAIHRARKPSAEQLDRLTKMSEARRGKNLTEEHRAKLSEVRRGRKRSEETKARMSAAQKGRIIGEEHRSKLSAAKLDAMKNPEVRRRMSVVQPSSLSDDEVDRIRAMIADGTPYKVISQSFSRSVQLICDIKHGRKYALRGNP